MSHQNSATPSMRPIHADTAILSMQPIHTAASTPPVRPIHTAAATPHARPVNDSSATSTTRSIDAANTAPLPVLPVDPAVDFEKVGQLMQLKNICSNIKMRVLV